MDVHLGTFIILNDCWLITTTNHFISIFRYFFNEDILRYHVLITPLSLIQKLRHHSTTEQCTLIIYNKANPVIIKENLLMNNRHHSSAAITHFWGDRTRKDFLSAKMNHEDDWSTFNSFPQTPTGQPRVSQNFPLEIEHWSWGI